MYPHLAMLYATYIMKDPDNWTLDKVPAMIRGEVAEIVEEMTKKSVGAE